MSLIPQQRQWARFQFLMCVYESSGNDFEKLFHRVMEIAHDDYVPVRAVGNLGDQGADGLGLSERKLYACYGRESFADGARDARYKVRSDFESAVRQRANEFDQFVFVHNDHRGVHPEVSRELVALRSAYPNYRFSQLRPQRLWDKLLGCDRLQLEEVLGARIPVEAAVYDVGMAEIEPLLDHLSQVRREAPASISLAPPPDTKLAYNALGWDYNEAIAEGLKYSALVERYYAEGSRVVEHDEIAAGFAAYYQLVRAEFRYDPDEVMRQMAIYVLGQEPARPASVHACHVVLAHFFERCDIFDIPPSGWEPGQPHGWQEESAC
jgi:hypothetical protein